MTRVRPIPVSGIGRYSPALAGIGQLCRSFTCLNSQHCCNARL